MNSPASSAQPHLNGAPIMNFEIVHGEGDTLEAAIRAAIGDTQHPGNANTMEILNTQVFWGGVTGDVRFRVEGRVTS